MAVGREIAVKHEYGVFLLGPPQLRHGSDVLQVRRRQVRALLYYLAHAGGPVPREQLAFLFWPDRSDATARRNLSRLLSAARSELGADAPLTRGQNQIALDPERVWCDCAAFARLQREDGREASAEAVELYRGPVLDGFLLPDAPAVSRWQEEQQREHERRYLDLLWHLGRLCRVAGDLKTAVDYHQRYLAVDDLNEAVHRSLLSLYGEAGDRAAAAQQFERCGLILERELGVSPLPETRAAYEAAMSRQAPAAPVVPSWSVLPSLDLPLTGREEAWQALHDAYERRGTGGLILISGEPGVGKSRLMKTFALETGALALASSNPPGTQASAYTGIVAALRQALPHRERWQEIRPIWLAEAGRLLPEMGDYFPDLPQPVEVERAQAQARLFEGLTRCLLGLGRAGPLLLCLDDLHWADQATLAWLTSLPNRLADSGVCIFATYRPAHAGALADLRRAFSRPGLLVELPLSRLSPDAVEQILALLPRRPTDLPGLASRIHRATGGNTFFVLETLRVLLASGRLSDPPAELPLAPTVEAAIRRRLDTLSPLGRQVAETAAILATDLRVKLLQETAGRSALEIVEGLDELAEQQLLVGGDHRRFGHELLRQVAYDDISSWRRRILHRRAATALEASGAIQAAVPWATIAEHYDRAGQTTEAIRCHEQAARAAHAVYAHREAIQHLRRALELARPAPSAAAALLRLQEALGQNLVAVGEYASAEAAFRDALALLPPGDPLRRAQLERELAETLHPQQNAEAAEAVFRTALARLDGPPSEGAARRWQLLRLDILLSLHDALYFQDRPEAMAALNRETEALLEAVGGPEHSVRFYSRSVQESFISNRFTVPTETLPLGRRMLAEAEAIGDPPDLARYQFYFGFQLLWHYDFDEAGQHLRQALALAELAGILWLQNQCLAYLTVLYRFQGDTNQLEAILPRLAELSERVGYSNYIGVCAANKSWLNFRKGARQKARKQAEAALAAWTDSFYPFHWLANWVQLALALGEGRLADAVAAARAMLDPAQQQLRGELPLVLQEADRAWEENNPEETRHALQRAATLAEREGYL